MTRNAAARLAGLLYLAAVPAGGFGYGYTAFMPKEDPAALLAALQAGEQMLRWSVLIGAIAFVDYLVLAALLRRLLAATGRLAADLMVLLVISSVPLALAALGQRMELMALLDAAPTQLPPDAMSLLRREEILFQLATIFWGAWMLPLGWLAWRSGLVPKLIGIGMILGGFGYLTAFVLPVLGIVVSDAVGTAFLGMTVATEFAFMFWLVVKGAGARGEEPAFATA